DLLVDAPVRRGIAGILRAFVGVVAVRIGDAAFFDLFVRASSVRIAVILRANIGVIAIRVGSAETAARQRIIEDGAAGGVTVSVHLKTSVRRTGISVITSGSLALLIGSTGAPLAGFAFPARKSGFTAELPAITASIATIICRRTNGTRTAKNSRNILVVLATLPRNVAEWQKLAV
ncbi:hypothetical protein COU80_05855, partial [Candidatus Peregrinibacteria bacterium CG10_big_fil_rev_8_21_14_0_10_55_24]